MAFSDSYNSLYSTSDILVPVKAATVFAAHESSMFLGGQLIPVVSAPNGLVKIPKISGGTAANMGSGSSAIDDIAAAAVTGSAVDLVCDLYAARTVVRDLGAIDPAEIGRQLGNKISATFDADVALAMAGLTGQEITADDFDFMEEIFKAVATIRGNGETGQLYGVVGAGSYAALMSKIGSSAYAGGDLFQGQALRSGYFGTIAGVQMFVSSYLNATNTGVTGTKAAIFGADALRIAMQRNVDVEVARRAEAVGNDVVASLHATVGVIDANRGVLIKDATANS